MSLFLYQVPRAKNALTVAKISFEDHLYLKRLPLDEYISYDEAFAVYPKKDLYEKLVNTKTFNGFQLKGSSEIYIYPAQFYKWLQTYYKRKLTRTISSQQDFQYLH